MSAESPRHARSGGPLVVPSQPPADRSIIDAVSGFINDVKLTSSSTVDPKDVIQWARFETADINEPTPEGDSDTDIPPLLLILGYGAGVQVWLIPPNGEAQEVLSWRQGSVRVLRILPTPTRGDCFIVKRPLIALCDSASPGPAFCSLSFISIRGGEQVKSIKFKNPILDVLANKRSVVVSFSERFAVFDAGTLEDRMAVTTCYPCPCPLGGSSPINPLALGDRWLAYADKKLNPSKRSSGGCEGEGQSSYTATVLHAAKSLSKGLRGLGESVAHSLAGTRAASQSPSPPHADLLQPGVVSVIDIEGIEEEDGQDSEEPSDPLVAHFAAHSEPVIALRFDASGLVLVTADRRGHDFHVFRVNPHPCGPALASVHHLYVLHRGDTTAKVQDIAISGDCRWVAVSTLRGTTHVFATSPYGGAAGVRTHTQPRVVNRLSRFHRSAGLPIHAAPGSPKPQSPVGDGLSTGAWFPNPRLPPYPLPTLASPLAQLRPTPNLATHTVTRTSAGRQRLSSLSEDNNAAPLLARTAWGPPTGGASASRGPQSPHALYLMAANGNLMHLVLQPRPASSLAKEKICDDSPIELDVEAVAQWPLQRPPAAADLLAPLPPSNPLLRPVECRRCSDMCMSEEERWLAQVEIVTHAGPHRRLWMGPQFVFKTYNSTGSNSSLSEAETVEVDTTAGRGVARSNPVNMPGVRPIVPVLIDSGSASSLEHSPSDSFRRKSLLAETGRAASVCDVQLREDLAEAMKEDHGSRREEPTETWAPSRGVELTVDPLGTVVRAPTPAPPPRAPDPDDYTRANSDEATFRPVVRAPAPAPLADLPVCPLPHTTTIPVQSLGTHCAPIPADPPRPLPTAVVIPAALSALSDHDWDECDPPALRETPAPKVYSDISEVSASVNVSSVVQASKEVNRSQTVAESQTPQRVNNDRYEPKRVETAQEEKISSAEVKVKVSKRENSESKVASEKGSSVSKISSKKPLAFEVPCPKNCDDMKPLREEKSDPVAKKSSYKGSSSSDTKKEQSEMRISTKRGSPDTKTKRESSETKVSEKKESAETKPSTKKESSENNLFVEKEVVETKVSINNDLFVRIPSAEKELIETKRESSEKKLSAEKELTAIKTSIQKESTKRESPETKISAQKDVSEITKKENHETKLSTSSRKRDSSERDISSRKELSEESKPLWKKESSRLGWSIETQPIEKKGLSKLDSDVPKHLREEIIEIKTEEQAWDMLLSEPENQVLSISPQSGASDKSDETKSKPKKNRKLKKSQDDNQSKSEDDSFVEIHAIEEKIQPSSGDLVSISTPFEEIERSSCYLKTKKSRSPKKTIQKEPSPTQIDDWSIEDIDCTIKSTSSSKKKSITSEIEILPEWEKTKDPKVEKVDTIEMERADYTTMGETTSKEVSKDKKGKLMTLSQENRKSVEKALEADVKDVYVIDSTKDEFPEIQITSSRGSKMRKKSPQVKKSEEIDVIPEKPVKSWSSIAASKSVKKVEEKEINIKLDENDGGKKLRDKVTDKAEESDEKQTVKIQNKGKVYKPLEDIPSPPPLSLHEELMRLCKRTDIMVAECDAPSELNFVHEHHSLLDDLPPLELGFGLDDFKLDVMRDSLLEIGESKITSPICKINIDSILSSIKESSSMFNLIDLEKVPDKKVKDFSVVENDKIKSQEVKADDELKSEDREMEATEKSSDDENASPALSADSDKEDKKSTGASNITMPSSKQSSKSKKSRRKKK